MKKRSECECHCHTFGGKHIVPCCYDDSMLPNTVTKTEPNWISVNEELPEPGTWVFCLDNDGVFIAGWNGMWWDDFTGKDDEGVTHWMPIELPEGLEHVDSL